MRVKWKGKTDGAPAIMMAHYDVVPANEDAWELPAFEGLIKCFFGTIVSVLKSDGVVEGGTGEMKKQEERESINK